MTPVSRAWVASRLLVAGFCWLTAAYACVASSTFASLQFLQPRVFPWVGVFSDWHAAAGWLWLTCAAAALSHDIRRGDAAGKLAAAVLFLASAGVMWNTVSPVLPSLAGGTVPPVVAVAAFGIAIGFAAVDHLAATRVFGRSADDGGVSGEGRLLLVAVVTSLLVTALYAAFASASMAGAFEPDLLTEGLATGLLWSLVDHVWIGCAAFLAFAVAGRLAHAGWHYAAVFAMLAAACGLAFQRLVGTALGMHGAAAALVAVAFATSVVGTWGGVRLRRLSVRAPAHRTARHLLRRAARGAIGGASGAARARRCRHRRRRRRRVAAGRLGLRAAQDRRRGRLDHGLRDRASHDRQARAPAGLGRRARVPGPPRRAADDARQRGPAPGAGALRGLQPVVPPGARSAARGGGHAIIRSLPARQHQRGRQAGARRSPLRAGPGAIAAAGPAVDFRVRRGQPAARLSRRLQPGGALHTAHRRVRVRERGLPQRLHAIRRHGPVGAGHLGRIGAGAQAVRAAVPSHEHAREAARRERLPEAGGARFDHAPPAGAVAGRPGARRGHDDDGLPAVRDAGTARIGARHGQSLDAALCVLAAAGRAHVAAARHGGVRARIPWVPCAVHHQSPRHRRVRGALRGRAQGARSLRPQPDRAHLGSRRDARRGRPLRPQHPPVSHRSSACRSSCTCRPLWHGARPST